MLCLVSHLQTNILKENGCSDTDEVNTSIQVSKTSAPTGQTIKESKEQKAETVYKGLW